VDACWRPPLSVAIVTLSSSLSRCATAGTYGRAWRAVVRPRRVNANAMVLEKTAYCRYASYRYLIRSQKTKATTEYMLSETGGLIVIQRERRFVGSAMTWKIMVDGKAEAEIHNGQTISIEVGVGEHLVYLRAATAMNPGPNSNRLKLRIDAGHEIRLTCIARPSPLRPKLQVGDAISGVVVETDRYEFPVGDEVRTIDNSQGTSPIVRTFRLSREWSKSYTLGSDQSITVTTSVGYTPKLAEIRMQAGRTIGQHYSTSSEERRAFEDTVTVTVAPRTRSEITFAWKEIRQRGYVEQTEGATSITSRVPFELVLGLTYDPRQIDT